MRLEAKRLMVAKKHILPDGLMPRPYQANSWNAVIRPDFRRGMMVWPRRNGKDLVSWNLTIAKAMQRVGTYFYMAPYYSQARQIIWEGKDGNGRAFIDYAPDWLIGGLRNKGREKQEMRQRLPNGSVIKLVGSDNIDAVVGTNPVGIVFTEFSLHKRGAWDYLRPVLAENDGWALFNGTPRGTANEMYELYELASQPTSPWFLQHLTRDDTGYPSLEAIQADRDSGMPEALIQQEYYTSFLSGNVGAYYSTEMAMLRMEDRIGDFPWRPELPVYTFWDLGKRDACAVWFAQIDGHRVYLIDYYEIVDSSLINAVKTVRMKPYVYGSHFAPFDIEVEEMSDKKCRWDTAADHGIMFETVPKLSKQEGIEAARQVLPRCYFNKVKTEKGRKALQHYHKKYDPRTETYSEEAAKSWANHGSDAFRYLSLVIDSLIAVAEYKGAPPRVITSIRRGQIANMIRRKSRTPHIPIVGADYLRRLPAHG